MPIRWKVVRERSRRSCVVAPSSRHSIIYREGERVEENWLANGIMTFETKKQAENFRSRFTKPLNFITIKVFGYGRGKKYNRVITVRFNTFINFEKNLLKEKTAFGYYRVYTRSAPDGTICYKSVKVLT